MSEEKAVTKKPVSLPNATSGIIAPLYLIFWLLVLLNYLGVFAVIFPTLTFTIFSFDILLKATVTNLVLTGFLTGLFAKNIGNGPTNESIDENVIWAFIASCATVSYYIVPMLTMFSPFTAVVLGIVLACVISFAIFTLISLVSMFFG